MSAQQGRPGKPPPLLSPAVTIPRPDDPADQPDGAALIWWARGYAAGYDTGRCSGYWDGRHDGVCEYDTRLVEALSYALGGSGPLGDGTSRREAVRRHLRFVDQRAARRTCDAQAAKPRPGDIPGGAPRPREYPRGRR